MRIQANIELQEKSRRDINQLSSERLRLTQGANELLTQKDRFGNEEEETTFNPIELVSTFDGWELYRKKKVPHIMVRRYCQTLDHDYIKNKITVCAHLNNIFDLYTH